MTRLRSLLILSLLWVPTVSLAETSGAEISLFANYWDVKDGDDNVWGPGIAAGVPLGMKDLKLDLRASWLPDAGDDTIGDLEIVPLDLGLSWHWVEENFDIYPMAGVTYAFVDAEAKGDIDVDVDDEWGAYAGLGLSYAFVENFALFTNVHYRFIDFDADSRNDLADFSKFDAYGLNVDVGVKFLF